MRILRLLTCIWQISAENGEKDPESAKRIFELAVERKIQLISPTLLKAEVANVLLKKKKLDPEDVKIVFSIIAKTGLVYTGLSDKLILEAITVADKYDLSVYDGIYLACAKFSGTTLISADEKGHGKIEGVILLKDFK